MAVHNCKYCKADCAFKGEDQQRNCNGHIHMTNADRIRAMTDEELACFICDRISNCVEQYCPGAGTCGIRIGKASGLVEWLQQPAEVSHD